MVKEVVIHKEDAVFRLDAEGFWRNSGGKFQNRKIIDYFHASIQKDEAGYHLRQVRDNIVEKVYFPYEDTALFVFDVLQKPTLSIRLNTGHIRPLSPDSLYVRNDHLYCMVENEPAKFTDRALTRLSDHLDQDENGFGFVDGNTRIRIPGR